MRGFDASAQKQTYLRIAVFGVAGILGLSAASLLAPNGLQLAAAASARTQSAPLFATLDTFVLFGAEGVSLDENAQVSSGDVGSNDELAIGRANTVNGDLFADKVTLDNDALINGNATYNKLKSKKNGQVLGTQTKSISLPVATLSAFSDFTVGTQDVTVTDTTTILPAGNYRIITIAGSSTLTLSGGTYNFSSLNLEDNATLIYTTSAILNIQSRFNGKTHIAIIPGADAHPDDLIVNYIGKPVGDGHEGDEQNASLRDSSSSDEHTQEQNNPQGHKSEDQKGEGHDEDSQSIQFGDNAFLNCKLIAPTTQVTIGSNTTLRGQVLAKRVRIGKSVLLSRTESIASIPDASKVVTDGNTRYIGNEIVVQFTDTSSPADAERIANSVHGTIAGIIPDLHLYKIQVNAASPTDLQTLAQSIIDINDPSVVAVTLNFLSAF